jgi:hypothetical protein
MWVKNEFLIIYLIMKTKNIILSLLMGISFSSCNDFLNTVPSDKLAPTNYYETEADMNAAIAGVYDVLGYSSLYAYGLVTRMASEADEGFYASTGLTNGIQFYNEASVSSDVLSLWTQLYDGISRANAVLANIDKPTMNETKRGVIRGEALFLRAFYYFWLVENWGDVPIVTKLPTDVTNNSVARSPANDVYNMITKDMIEAETLVPNITDIGYGGRINKSAVRGILARVYLQWAGYPLNNVAKYQDARDWALKVINDGVANHQLNPSYSQVFVNLAQNIYDIKESIWECEFSNKGISSAEDGQIGSWIGISTNDATIGTAYGFINVLPRLYNSYEPGDLRRDRAIADFQYLNNGNVVSYWSATQLYNRDVGKWRRSEETDIPKLNQATPTNFPILRYSDVLLMYAEAENELNPTPPQAAIDAVNLVRHRAWSTGIKSISIESGGSGYTSAPTVLFTGGGGTGAVAQASISNGKVSSVSLLQDPVMGHTMGTGYATAPAITFTGGGGTGATATATIYDPEAAVIPVMNKDEFRSFIQDERSRELCFEGLRKYDLIRWHILIPTLNLIGRDIDSSAPSAYKYASLSFNNAQEKNYFLPIPASEMALNNKLVQNPGY